MTNYLCLDFGSNRYEGVRNTVFSTGLEEQFSILSANFKNQSFEDFILIHFAVTEQTVYFSYPNFVREKQTVEKARGQYYRNVAVRFPQKYGKTDIVLMGDIFERDRDSHRQFKVKAILTVDPKTIPDSVEIEVTDCTPVLQIEPRGQWQCNGSFTDWPTDEQKRYSTLTDDFMIDLNGSYVVKDPEAAEKTFEIWEKYLGSRKYLIDTESTKGYDLRDCVPDVIRAYCVEGTINQEEMKPVPYLDTSRNGVIWVMDKPDTSRYPTARESVLLHLYISFNKKEAEELKESRKIDVKKKFDSFTKAPNVLVDPTIPIDKDRRKNQLVQIRDGRIAPSNAEDVPPEEELRALDDARNRTKAKAERDIEEARRKEVKLRLDSFVATELPRLAEAEVEAQRGPVTRRNELQAKKRIEEERARISNAIKALEEEIKSAEGPITALRNESDFAAKESSQAEAVLERLKDSEGKAPEKDISAAQAKLRSCREKENVLKSRLSKLVADSENRSETIDKLRTEYQSAEARFDPGKDIERELGRIREEFISRMTLSKREDIESELGGPYAEKRVNAINEIDRDFDARVETARRDHTELRLHVYYELDVPDTDSPEQIIKRLVPRMKPELLLRKDFTGDWVLIDRQSRALNSLLEGYVMNPFLATALLSPDGKVKDTALDIDSMKYFTENLNNKQKEAVVKALSANGVFLLQGPPGTGKTQVIAEITAQLAVSGRKVLIASENHKAVDNAFSRLPKMPTIRPMRILTEDSRAKENPYSMARLLDNFYNNITMSLEKELRKYTDHQQYMSDLSESIEKLEDLAHRIDRYSVETEAVKERILDLQRNLDSEYNKKDKLETDNDTYRNKIMEKEEELSRILDIDDEKIIGRILDELQGIGFNASSYGMEPIKMIRLLRSTDSAELENEFIEMEFHQKLFDLRARKKTASAADIASINSEIEKYLSYNDLDEEETFRILRKLNPVPPQDKVLEAKGLIDSILGEEERRYRKFVDDLERKIDPTKLEIIQSQITRIKNEIEDARTDGAYRSLEKVQSEFETLVKDVLARLNLTITYSSPAEVIDKLMNVRDNLEREYRNNREGLDDRVDAYKRIVKYLRDEQVIDSDRDQYKSELLRTVNVFGMTCTTNDRFESDEEKIRLNELNIDVVIIDEVSKIPFVELLHPILYGKTVILVGDHKQLPPMFTERISEDEMEKGKYDPEWINPGDEKRYKKEYETSFFAKLFHETSPRNKIMLDVQYRMHPDIMDVDNVFYDNQLKAGINAKAREHYLNITGAYGRKIIGEDTHVVFVDCKGKEVQESGSTSFYNENEIVVVRKLLELINRGCRCDRNGKPLTGEVDRRHDTRLSVGVICPYADQAKRIRGKKVQKYRSFNDSGDEKFMVKTVDDFQGDERDIIILSMVRTTSKARFLMNYHRINVAISRARRLLIIVGNRKALEPMLVPMDDDMGTEKGPGRKLPIYRNMISTIERKNGILTEDTITGGE